MPKALTAAALTLCVALGLAACSSDSKSSSDTTTTKADKSANQPAPVTVDGSVTNKGTKDVSTKGASATVDLDAYNFYFEPTFIKAAPGQKLKIELHNEGSVTHTFTDPALNIDQVLQPEQKADVEITVPATGTIQFYCRFHRDSGMQGAIYTTAS
jgi:plastocyanin